MAVTRLERKGRKNKAVAKKRKGVIKHLTAKPVLKNIDIEAVKAEFEKKGAVKSAPKKEEKPKAEAKAPEVKEVKTEKAKTVEATPEVKEKKETKAKAEPKTEAKKKAEKKPAAKKETKKAEKKEEKKDESK